MRMPPVSVRNPDLLVAGERPEPSAVGLPEPRHANRKTDAGEDGKDTPVKPAGLRLRRDTGSHRRRSLWAAEGATRFAGS